MNRLTNLIMLFVALAAVVFYCRISNATVCYNQSMADDDGCDVYVVTD